MVSMPPQDSPADDAQSGLSLAQLWSIARAYRVQIAIIAICIIAGTAVVIKLMPKTYSSTATLMVNYASNDPMVADGLATGPLGAYISTEMELMQSAGVLVTVVDQLNLTSDKNYTAGYRPGVGDLRQWAAEVVGKNLEIEQGRFGSQLIYITASARDPVLAASIANTVSTVYLEQQRRRVYGPATERATNYAKELAELKYKVGVAQDQVTAFRQKSGITDASQTNNNVEADLLATLEQRYQDAQNQRRAAEVAASAESGPASTSVMGSPLIQNLRQQLDDQNKQLAQLRATMGPSHPRVMELQSQIEATHRSLENEIATYSSNVSAQLAAAREMEKKLAAAVEEQRTKVLGVRKLQDEGTKFALELESAQSVYKRALDGYDQIMFASGEHYTNINFVSRAAPVMKALKPNKPKLMLIGLAAGLLFGFAGPFAYELVLNRRVRCRDDFERKFGVHVLTEFDAIEFTPSSA
jgi:uncharacterized protein involved in exopolysaccharide biosynthesis